MAKAFQAEFAEQGILKIIFDLPESKVNIFNADTIQELDRLIEELKVESAIKAAYLVSGKENNFLAGADVAEIMKINTSEDGYVKSRLGQTLFERWRQLPFPTLAIVDGSCVGGGTEWMLAFTYRMSSDRPETQIGLPEVKLGIIPGWGGTVRLPHLIGVRNALKLILSGHTVSGKRAYQMGITDDFVPHKMIDAAAVAFLKKILEDGDKNIRNRRKKNPSRRDFLETTRLGRNLVFKRARKKVLEKTGGNYPAPFAAIQSVIFACDNNLEDALMFEARKFAVLAASAISKNLVRIYFLTEEVKKHNGVKNPEIQPEKIDKIGILGAGTAGSGIAYLSIMNRHPVRLKDMGYEPLSKAMAYVRNLLDKQVKKDRLTERQTEHIMDRLSPTVEYTGFALTDLIVESIAEDRILKSETIEQIDRCTPNNTIFALNTATFSISELSNHCRQPDRVAGFHLFPPFHKTGLVEIVRGKQTSDQTIATLFALARQWNKYPVVVADTPGFLRNRLLIVYLAEAVTMLQEGASVQLIDKSMQRFGMFRGPFGVMDELGIDVAINMAKALKKHLGKRLPSIALLEEMVKAERLGQKNKRGFYRPASEETKPGKVDKRIYKELNLKLKRGFESLEIQDRLVYLMVNEAVFCLEEGIISHPGEIEGAAVFGMGFPAFRGGLLRYADEVGITKIMGRLWYFSEMIGERYTAAPLLTKISESEQKIYQYLEALQKGTDLSKKKEKRIIKNSSNAVQ
jgi:3-hydroxyacyl-CoA dehydrogenase/enoyl-CoA hydratase/3-hydroxybutyryl-CoA epimerase